MAQEKKARVRPLARLLARRPRRELELAEREIRDIRYAIDQAAIVAITDAAGTITFVNEKFCEISKYSREELLGKTHRIINSGVHSPEFFRELWKTISGGEVWRGEICNRAKDGSLYWVATVIVPFLTPAGRPRQYIALRTDITERKKAEERAKKAIEAREEFLAIVSHDLKNPLSSIALNSELIQRSAARMHRMVSDLLDMSRLEAEGLELAWATVPVADLISEAAEMAAVQALAKEIRIERKLHVENLEIPCDKGRILQVLANLVGNAIKFSPTGSVVTIEAFRKDNRLDVCVLDQGPGVPADQLGQVFKRFWRASTQAGGGSGLGLYIAKSVVEAHGGEISVQNRPEGGAVFEFSLPITRGRGGSSPKPPAAKSSR